jgi:hypothetical protein
MTPDHRRNGAVADPGPVPLIDRIGRPPEAPRPKAARSRRFLPAGIEPMLGIDDVAARLAVCRRVVERMRSAGEIPKPDIKIGKMPRWKFETIEGWIDREGKP